MASVVLDCRRCGGLGEVEVGFPGCKCPLHDHAGAECWCNCEHYGDTCDTCGGTGVKGK